MIHTSRTSLLHDFKWQIVKSIPESHQQDEFTPSASKTEMV